MNYKRFVLLAAVIVIVMAVPSLISEADETSADTSSGTTGDCTWTLDGTVLTISGSGAMADYTEDSLPSWIEGGGKLPRSSSLTV